MPLAISGTELEPSESIAQLIDCARALAISFVEVWYPRNTGTDGLKRTFSLIREAGLRIACISTGSELYRRGGSVEDQKLLNQASDITRRPEVLRQLLQEIDSPHFRLNFDPCNFYWPVSSAFHTHTNCYDLLLVIFT